MRRVEGYVCTACLKNEPYNTELLFGKNRGRGTHSYESFQTNDLTPFNTPEEVIRAYQELRERQKKAVDTGRVGIAQIRIEIAENEKDVEIFKDKKNLITIMYGEGDVELFGRRVENRLQPGSGYLPGMFLTYNGWWPFPTLERAKYSVAEINRQAQSRAQIATFEFKRLKPGNLRQKAL